MDAERVEVEIVDAADVDDRRPGTSRRMGQELEPELEMLAHWMDSAFHIPGIGIRFGLDAIIGLIPGLGDTLTSLASLYILNAGRRYGVPRVTMLRMAANIALDYVVGVIPFLGDAFDVVWKANQKNVALLRRHVLATPAEERRARVGDWLVLAGLVAALALVLVGAVTTAVWIWSSIFHWFFG
ncbi:MAG TPA: DUF4112 domain-containing protein [Pirellulales bacterium]|jgi:hypothetical protein|nr:DUF4112 domain-containing protein [Pirellulales bacterium]